MDMIVEFDIGADLIEVPEWVVRDRERLYRRFFKWLYGFEGSRRYRKGGCWCYRSEAFVYWLNKKVLTEGEQARVVREQLREWDKTPPGIFF